MKTSNKRKSYSKFSLGQNYEQAKKKTRTPLTTTTTTTTTNKQKEKTNRKKKTSRELMRALLRSGIIIQLTIKKKKNPIQTYFLGKIISIISVIINNPIYSNIFSR